MFVFILHQKIQKMVKCTFWYWLTQVVPDIVQRAIKWLLLLLVLLLFLIESTRTNVGLVGSYIFISAD